MATTERQAVRLVLDLDMSRASIDITSLVRWMLKVCGRAFDVRCLAVTWTTDDDADDVKAHGKATTETTA